MQPGHPFSLDVSQSAIVVFVLAMTFLSGVLGGYFFGLTDAVRGHGHRESKSIWEYDEEE
jgi:hypothetical protein